MLWGSFSVLTNIPNISGFSTFKSPDYWRMFVSFLVSSKSHTENFMFSVGVGLATRSHHKYLKYLWILYFQNWAFLNPMSGSVSLVLEMLERRSMFSICVGLETDVAWYWYMFWGLFFYPHRYVEYRWILWSQNNIRKQQCLALAFWSLQNSNTMDPYPVVCVGLKIQSRMVYSLKSFLLPLQISRIFLASLLQKLERRIACLALVFWPL